MHCHSILLLPKLLLDLNLFASLSPKKMPQYLETTNDFKTALANAGDKVVVVDFTASWCGPCQMIGPKFEAMSKEFTNVLFYKVRKESG